MKNLVIVSALILVNCIAASCAIAQGMNWNSFEFEQVNQGEMSDPVLVLESLDNVYGVEQTTSGAKASIWVNISGIALGQKRGFIPIQYKQRARCDIRLDVKEGRYRIIIMNAEGYLTGFDMWLSLDPRGVKRKLQESCKVYAREIHEHIYRIVKAECEKEHKRSDW